MPVKDIIAQFGGTTEMARLLGVPISTVDSWRKKNRIPEWRRGAVLTIAVERGVPLSTTDLDRAA